MRLTGYMQGTPMGVLQSAANNLGAANPGAEVAADDGSIFRLALVGAVNIPAGVLVGSPALVANHLTRTLNASYAVGASMVLVPLGATAATAGQYANGKLVVVDGTGAGLEVGIKGNAANAGSSDLQINLQQDLPIALDNTSVVSLIPNLYNGVVINPASPVGQTPVGVSPTTLAAGTWVWIQTKGSAAVLNDGGTAVGLGLAPSASVAGAVKTMAATLCQVGRSLEAGVDTKKHTAFFNI